MRFAREGFGASQIATLDTFFQHFVRVQPRWTRDLKIFA